MVYPAYRVENGMIHRMRILSKAKIRQRLNETARFTPWDNWEHVINQLRKGRVYFVIHPTKGRMFCGFFK